MQNHIRNFCIIAHIDHGKSTLADRFLDFTHAITDREKREQFLDQMDLERERGITIKAQTVRLAYKAKDGKEYELNLIDTPGHVDFHYEVSRSLQACEGAILLVDASQGVQAQTLANALLAMDQGLALLPVINKIDLPSVDLPSVLKQMEEVLGISPEEILMASGKTGEGVEAIFEAIIQRLPPPRGILHSSLRALMFDSWFDSYQGAVALLRVFDGELHNEMEVRLINAGKNYKVQKLGIFSPRPQIVTSLKSGEVGFCILGIKDVRDARIGDTLTSQENPAIHPLPGFKEVKPIVFSGLYPVDSESYEDLKEALEKLRLNDSSFSFEPETSAALGFGFRCGFLGSLHMEIIQERLEREYKMNLITTAPTVVYRVRTTDGAEVRVDNPAKLPEVQKIESILEPYAKVQIHTPTAFVGSLIAMCEASRGRQENIQYFGEF